MTFRILLLTIAIPAHNKSDFLKQAIYSIKKELDFGKDVNIVISDNSSNDEIKDKDVIWSLNGKKVKSKLMDTRDIKVGDKTETRPMIELDLKFQQTVHKYIFTLDDRGDRTTPLLINKNFMTELNLAMMSRFLPTMQLQESG